MKDYGISLVPGTPYSSSVCLTYAYDDFDHVSRMSWPDGGSATFTYNSAVGPYLVTRTTDRASRVSTSEYKAARSALVSMPPARPSHGIRADYFYDELSAS